MVLKALIDLRRMHVRTTSSRKEFSALDNFLILCNIFYFFANFRVLAVMIIMVHLFGHLQLLIFLMTCLIWALLCSTSPFSSLTSTLIELLSSAVCVMSLENTMQLCFRTIQWLGNLPETRELPAHGVADGTYCVGLQQRARSTDDFHWAVFLWGPETYNVRSSHACCTFLAQT